MKLHFTGINSLKAIILAGGLGSRLSEETHLKPKPMIEIGDMPILWHIMKYLSCNGINDFIILLGYKGYLIKEFFVNYTFHTSDINISLKDNKIKIVNPRSENWNINLIDTGSDTMTGGRLLRIESYLEDNEDFLMTYGDGLSNIDIKSLIDNHKKKSKIATITAVKPPGRFGALDIDNNFNVTEFNEKPKGDGVYINGGYFILNKKVMRYIKNDQTVWEKEPLEKLTQEKQLNSYIHNDFWMPMDTLRDKNMLNLMWNENKAPWRIW